MKSLQKLIFSKTDVSSGITLINSMDLEQFKKLIDICYKTDNGHSISKDEIVSSLIKDTDFDQNKSEHIVSVLLHLKNILGKLIMKPKDLQDFLTEKVKLDNNKTEIFIKAWSSKPNYVLNQLKNGQHLDGIAWELYTEVADNSTFTFPDVKGKLQFFIADNTNSTDSLSLDLNHSEIYKLYSEFEQIQNVLDSLK